MKIQELRTGNIVAINNPKSHPSIVGVALRVTGIHENSNGYVVNLEHINKEPDIYYESYCQKIEFVEPIPITEELLLKCGFEMIDGSEVDEPPQFRKNNFFIISNTWAIQTFYISDYEENIFEYLHQLQNLYFALTGEELEVQL